jgi:hypothetical protein
LVEATGDEGTRQAVDAWALDWWKREAITQKFNSNKRWGLVRGDAYFYIYASPNKVSGRRISMIELDPRYVFEIDAVNDPQQLDGVHIVESVQDFRQPDKPAAQIARRRTFRKVYDPTETVIAITSELTHWEIGKWDDRSITAESKQEQVPWPEMDEPVFELPQPIVQLPVYKWCTRKMQGTTWGTSLLAGMETIMYSINQSITDEDATMVFQGLGMYMTNAGPPLDDNGNITDWNIGPKQIIEIGAEQTFERVTGVSDVSPFQDHINMLNDKGISEAGGLPEIAIGRVDVTTAESGISLTLQMAPLISANEETELDVVTTMDQCFNDIVTMWLPAYESEVFGNIDVMAQMSMVSIFDNPMPDDRTADIQETVLLEQSNLILTSMAIAKLRDLGWKYPDVDPTTGAALDDTGIAALLSSQAATAAAALDPYGLAGTGTGTDGFGAGIDNSGGDTGSSGTSAVSVNG